MAEAAAPAPEQSVALTPRVGELDAVFRRRYRLFDDVVSRSARLFGRPWVDDLEETLERMFPAPGSLDRAVAGYVAFVMDTMRRQRAFERDGVYPDVSYDDAARAVYLNDGYMASEYLPGLLLSHYLWTHHFHMLRFFDSAFASSMEVAGAREFVEVAVGTGIYSRRILRLLPRSTGVGYDVSPAVKRFAEDHVGRFGMGDRFRVRLQDIRRDRPDPCRWLVCVELLEHMDDPTALLQALRELLAPGGRAFITTAINAPSADHVYLYRDPGEVVEHLEQAGFGLEQSFTAPAFIPSRPGAVAPTVAAFVVV